MDFLGDLRVRKALSLGLIAERRNRNSAAIAIACRKFLATAAAESIPSVPRFAAIQGMERNWICGASAIKGLGIVGPTSRNPRIRWCHQRTFISSETKITAQHSHHHDSYSIRAILSGMVLSSSVSCCALALAPAM